MQKQIQAFSPINFGPTFVYKLRHDITKQICYIIMYIICYI